eukprot:TRINITY_DN5271_c0_g1_i1.p1 TRINITY_DN5271_c0_g1~~TRINITY_DN5271_c0_g1_i1.p1  ORF type:complete len:524 (-),score=109.53 TRINITY_DN5271_c0_g1_i1:314-1738(-)
MLRSLVGSEMCIRDSRYGGRRASMQEDEVQLQPVDLQEDNGLITNEAPSDAEDDGLITNEAPSDLSRTHSGSTYQLHWAHWLLRVLWVLGTLMALVGIPFGVARMHDREYETHEIAWFLAGTFVFLTIPISLWEIMQHVHHLTQPELQKPIIRILWLVPIYSVSSYLAMIFKHGAVYFNTARECYEAYVIYSFLRFLMSAIGGEERIVRILLARPNPPQHMFPFNRGVCSLPPWSAGWGFLGRCKNGILSYVVLRVVCTAIALISEWAGCYCESEFDPKCSWPWLAVVTNFSQCWALYCLVLIYHELNEELRYTRPLPKFLSVKLVVFFSFWQAVGIAILVRVNLIKQNPAWTDYTVDDVATGMQDFLICIEMFFAALAHKWVFSYKEYRTTGSREHGIGIFCRNMLAGMFDVSDVAEDFGQHAKDVKQGLTETIGRAVDRFQDVEEEDVEEAGHESRGIGEGGSPVELTTKSD